MCQLALILLMDIVKLSAINPQEMSFSYAI